jgi:Rrf2 family protein
MRLKESEFINSLYMLKLTKKADYGLIALKHLAETAKGDGAFAACSTKEIAEAYDLPQEALAKILQRLVKGKFLISHHGTNGGYMLSRRAEEISALEVILAIDGPLFITSCSTDHSDCQQMSKCNVKEPLAKVSHSIREVLAKISIADMMDPKGPRSGSLNEVDEAKPAQAPLSLVTLA